MATKLVGIALFWVGLAALLYASSDHAAPHMTWVLAAGFIAFAAGLHLFSEGFKRELLREIEGIKTT